MEENLVNLLSNLHLDDNRHSTLVQLNTVLSRPTVNLGELEEICQQNVGFRPLLDCLNSSDRNEIELVCSILEKIFSTISPVSIITYYQNDLNRGVSHPNPTVKQFTLKELCRFTKEVPASNSIVTRLDLLETIVALIADENADVVKQCHEFLVSLASSNDGLEVLFSQRVLERLNNDVASRSDVVRFRIYDIMIKISRQSEKGFEKCVVSGMIPRLVSEAKNDDVLVQLNCLELLSDLAMCPHGMSYLENHAVIRNLENMLDQTESSSMANFILPGLLKFFGCVGHLYPKEICTQYPIFMNKLFDALNSSNVSFQCVAIETIGILGSSLEGKMVLEKLGKSIVTFREFFKGESDQNKISDKMLKCMDTLGSIINTAGTEIKIKALNTLKSLLSLKESEQTTELIYLLKLWFDSAANGTPVHLIALMRSPFQDLRLAAMLIFEAIAKLTWGQTYMNDSPSFVEYLLDRSSETTKDGKELKYEIIRILAESPTTNNTMGSVVFIRLKEYVKEGPFYVSTEVAVAVDGSN